MHLVQKVFCHPAFFLGLRRSRTTRRWHLIIKKLLHDHKQIRMFVVSNEKSEWVIVVTRQTAHPHSEEHTKTKKVQVKVQ